MERRWIGEALSQRPSVQSTLLIEEFMTAAVEVFGDKVLLQFEDFNSNDAFPLLEQYRDKFLTYNGMFALRHAPTHASNTLMSMLLF